MGSLSGCIHVYDAHTHHTLFFVEGRQCVCMCVCACSCGYAHTIMMHTFWRRVASGSRVCACVCANVCLCMHVYACVCMYESIEKFEKNEMCSWRVGGGSKDKTRSSQLKNVFSGHMWKENTFPLNEGAPYSTRSTGGADACRSP